MAEMKRFDLSAKKEIAAIELPNELKLKLGTSMKVKNPGLTRKPIPDAPPKHLDIQFGPHHIDGIRPPSPVESVYYPVQIQGVLDRKDITDLGKLDCVIEKNTVYIPETKVAEVAKVLNTDRFISRLK